MSRGALAPSASRTQNLVLPGVGARQDQGQDVARDEQNDHGHDRHEQEDDRPGLQIVVRRLDHGSVGDLHLAAASGVPLVLLIQDDVELRLGGPPAVTRRQPAGDPVRPRLRLDVPGRREGVGDPQPPAHDAAVLGGDHPHDRDG